MIWTKDQRLRVLCRSRVRLRMKDQGSRVGEGRCARRMKRVLLYLRHVGRMGDFDNVVWDVGLALRDAESCVVGAIGRGLSGSI